MTEWETNRQTHLPLASSLQHLQVPDTRRILAVTQHSMPVNHPFTHTTAALTNANRSSFVLLLPTEAQPTLDPGAETI